MVMMTKMATMGMGMMETATTTMGMVDMIPCNKVTNKSKRKIKKKRKNNMKMMKCHLWDMDAVETEGTAEIVGTTAATAAQTELMEVGVEAVEAA